MSAPAIVEHRRGGVIWFSAEHLERRGVPHGFAARTGGASRGPFASLNFSSREGDVPARVVENWARLEAAASLPAAGWALLSQVHGARVERVVAGAAACHHRRNHAAADALVTAQPNVVLGVLTADCLPVVLAVPGGSAVAIAHAGWRGTLEGVVQETVRELVRRRAAPSRARYSRPSARRSAAAASRSALRSTRRFTGAGARRTPAGSSRRATPGASTCRRPT